MRSHVAVTVLSLAMLANVCVVPAYGGVRVGLQGGLNESGLTYRPDYSILDHELKYRPAWSAGVVVEVPLQARLSLDTGIRYVEYGDRLDIQFDITGGTARFGTHQVWRYLAVPALVRLRPFAARDLFLGLGPEVGYLLTVWHKESLTSTSGPTIANAYSGARPRDLAEPTSQIFEDVGTFDNPTPLYRRWNLAVCGTLGCELPIGGHIGDVQVRYTRGVTDIAKSAVLRRETMGLEALVGIRW